MIAVAHKALATEPKKPETEVPSARMKENAASEISVAIRAYSTVLVPAASRGSARNGKPIGKTAPAAARETFVTGDCSGTRGAPATAG